MEVGDRVLILRGGYTTCKGVRDGDVGIVVALVTGRGAYVTGLPGTQASQDHPYGLYFRNYEIQKVMPVNTNAEEDSAMSEYEGKYFRNNAGWIVGPLKAGKYYGEPAFIDNLGRYYSPELKSVAEYSGRHLIPEPLELGEVVEKVDVSLGDCVQYDGSLYWVVKEDRWDWLLQNSDESTWVDKTYKFKVIPNFSVKTSEPPVGNLVDKWVWVTSRKDHCKISRVNFDFTNPLTGFDTTFSVVPPGRTFSSTVSKDDVDLSTLLDQHPREATLVRGIQGKGKYLYAQNKEGEYFLVVSSDYEQDYYFFSMKDGDSCMYSLHPKQNVWWDYQVYRTDTLPFTLPFSYELCVETAKDYCQVGRNTLQQWVMNNYPKAVVSSILSRAKMASNTRGNIALYLNESQMKAQKIQSLRPGRALRALIPDIKDADLEKLVDKFRKDFPAGDYTVKRSFAAEDFKRAYSGTIAPMQNPCTTSSRKSLANSCMRHDFSHLKHHPAEAYASGEFEMLWTETPEGKIGSRMVVWHPPVGHRKHGTPQCGPVYGTCEYSMDLLQDLMVKEQAVLFHESTWVGAKLARINKSGSEVFLPFIDNEQGLEVYEDHLIITDEDPEDCNCAANVTGGYAYVSEGGSCTCARCGDRMDEDYAYPTDDGDMCEDCYSNNYFTCEEYDATYPVSEMCTVYRMQRWGASSQCVCEDARDSHYTLCEDGEYWHNDDILILADGSCLGGDAYDQAAECMMTNEYYLLDDLLPTAEGDFVSRDYYNNHKEDFTMNANGELEQLEEAA